MIDIKLKSRKFIVAIWSMVLLSTLTIWSMASKFEPSWMPALFPFLAIIIGAWVGVQGLIDKDNSKKKDKNE